MIKGIKRLIKCKKGTSFPLIIGVILSLMIIFIGISEYFRLMIISAGIRDVLQDTVISTTVENYRGVYNGVREGYSGGYMPSKEDFEESINYGDIYEKLENILGVSKNGLEYIKNTGDGELEYKIYNLEVNIRNAPFATKDNSVRRFEVDSIIIVEVPVKFGSKILPNLKMKIKTTGGYIPKF